MSDLPNEILLLISEEIQLRGPRDLLPLLLVCRHWYSIFLPKAYKLIYLCSEEIYRFVRSVQENPRIGPAIQHLFLDWSYWDEHIERQVRISKDILQQASASPTNCEEWQNALQAGNPDAWLAVLTLSLESVRTLFLRATAHSEYFIPMLARAAARDKPFDLKHVLQRLAYVKLETDDMEISFEAADYLPIFRLPAMRVFSANGLCEVKDWESIYPKPAPKTSTITELNFGSLTGLNFGSLGRCNGGKGMADFIISCANLEVFDYQHNNTAILNETSIDFRPRLFYEALCTQKHSLRELRLNNIGENDYLGDDADEEENFDGFGSLADFHQLRELRMPLSTLLQFDEDGRPRVSLLEILPPSLEYLQLAEYEEEDFDVVMENLGDVIAQREERFPNLEILEIQPYVMKMKTEMEIPEEGVTYDPSDIDVPVSVREAFAPFKAACEEMGISFAFSKDGDHYFG
jgi:hypothetical protein